jgi:Tfp pilus assembly protein PilE
VRWLLTRRAGLAIAIVAVMVLGTFNYSSYMTTLQEAERKKHQDELEAVQEAYEALQKGGSEALVEEALLAPDGATGG